LVGHYIGGDARQRARVPFPNPAGGNTLELERRAGGGACGEWVERDDRRAIHLTAVAVDPPTTRVGQATVEPRLGHVLDAAQDGEPPLRHAPKSAPAPEPYLRTSQHYYIEGDFGNALVCAPETLLSRG
jgi:hypothetical protein